MPKPHLRSRQALLAAAAAAMLAATPRVEAQCSMCKTVVTGSEEGRSLGGELNKAILVMVAAPYLVFGGFVAVLFRRRVRLDLPSALARRLRVGAGGLRDDDQGRPDARRR